MNTASDTRTVRISMGQLMLSLAIVSTVAPQMMAQHAYFYDRGPAPNKVDGVLIPNREEYGYYKTQWRRWPGTEERARAETASPRASDLPGWEPRPEDEDLGTGPSASATRAPTETTSDSDLPPLPPPDMEDTPPKFDFDLSRPPELPGSLTPADASPSLPIPSLPVIERPSPPSLQPPSIQPPGATKPKPPALPSFEELFPNPTKASPQGSGTSSSLRESQRPGFRESRRPAIARRPAQGITPQLAASTSHNPLRRGPANSRQSQSVQPVAYSAPVFGKPVVDVAKPAQRAIVSDQGDLRSNPLRRQ